MERFERENPAGDGRRDRSTYERSPDPLPTHGFLL